MVICAHSTHVRRIAVVQRKAQAFVLDHDALTHARLRHQCLSCAVDSAPWRRWSARRCRCCPAVPGRAGRRPESAGRAEQPIEIRQAAATDQRDRSAAQPKRPLQHVVKGRSNRYRVWVQRDIRAACRPRRGTKPSRSRMRVCARRPPALCRRSCRHFPNAAQESLAVRKRPCR